MSKMCYRVLDAADAPRSSVEAPHPSGVCKFKSCAQQETSARSHPGARQLWALLDVFTSRLLVEQREGPQRRTVRHVAQVRIAAALRVHAAEPADHRDVLLAVLLPGDGLTDDAGGSLEAPQHLTVLGIERLELAGQHAGEHEIARR